MGRETLVVDIRNSDTKAHRLRRDGYVPGVIYGQDRQSAAIMIEGKSLGRLYREVGKNAFFEISMENDIRHVRLREIQKDPVTKDILHVDIQLVNLDQRLKADVPINIQGGVETNRKGITIQRHRDSIKVVGLPQHIPLKIDVSVQGLREGGNIRIGDLEISEELSIMDDKQSIVLSAVKNSRLETETTDEREMEFDIEKMRSDLDVGG